MSVKRKHGMGGHGPLKRRGAILYDRGEDRIPDEERDPNAPRSNSAFPLYHGPGADDETFDAFEYLQRVRNEAKKIPHILTAPKPSTVVPGDDIGPRGRCADGAYIGVGEDFDTGEDTSPMTPVEACRLRMLQLFRAQRAALRRPLPPGAIEALGPDQPIHIPSRLKAARQTWWWMFKTRAPTRVQLAAMDKMSVLKALGMIREHLKRHRNVGRPVSQWVWGLLARMEDVGCLGSEEVAVVRELAKAADWVRHGFAVGKPGVKEDEVVEDEAVEDDAVEEEAMEEKETETELIVEDEPNVPVAVVEGERRPDPVYDHRNTSSPISEEGPQHGAETLEAAKARLLGNLSSSSQNKGNGPGDSEAGTEEYEPEPWTNGDLGAQTAAAGTSTGDIDDDTDDDDTSTMPNRNTRATIDMILLVVGVMYGQRDLLPGWGVWGGKKGRGFDA
ncbi:hypothetical protein EJ06DRAFT_558896 [Trichodelitschia bisporula]|uniref:Uncharacterized protein n=1 Tax=Trichodelitschia bisporula TaxID=703511 RepID=A0A6G1HN79_9PEZI|nr:hypothetical protein EJ06DRAFT_558896 [Trichodelitschia bisporula]